MSAKINAKRFGFACFAFFAIKGCVWLAFAAVVSMGLLNAH